MIHTQSNLKLMNEITEFLKNRNKNYELWRWALAVPLEDRLYQLFSKSKKLLSAVEQEEKIIENGSVLDLGCGFCPYWPFLNKLGYNRFVGYDLYSKRGYGSQEYMKTAMELAENFCKDSEFIIIEDDIRNISNFNPENCNFLSSSNINKIQHHDFDLIFTKNTDYKKVGSTGIPENIFENICKDYLRKDGIKLYAG
jgi:SAM-dependent methyltransferase